MPALLFQYQAIISAFLISVMVSFVRLMFYRDITFARTLSNFAGGVFLGMLLGYLLRANHDLGMWKEIIVALVSLLGKEITEGFIKIAPGIMNMIPEFCRMFLNNLINSINKKKE